MVLQCINSPPLFDTRLGDRDILLGRGTGPNDHVGNKMFRDLVLKHRAQYLNAKAGHEQLKHVFGRVVSIVHANGGRFLKKVGTLKTRKDSSLPPSEQKPRRRPIYGIITDPEVLLAKVKQAFRYSKMKEPSEDCGTPGEGFLYVEPTEPNTARAVTNLSMVGESPATLASEGTTPSQDDSVVLSRQTKSPSDHSTIMRERRSSLCDEPLLPLFTGASGLLSLQHSGSPRQTDSPLLAPKRQEIGTSLGHLSENQSMWSHALVSQQENLKPSSLATARRPVPSRWSFEDTMNALRRTSEYTRTGGQPSYRSEEPNYYRAHERRPPSADYHGAAPAKRVYDPVLKYQDELDRLLQISMHARKTGLPTHARLGSAFSPCNSSTV